MINKVDPDTWKKSPLIKEMDTIINFSGADIWEVGKFTKEFLWVRDIAFGREGFHNIGFFLLNDNKNELEKTNIWNPSKNDDQSDVVCFSYNIKDISTAKIWYFISFKICLNFPWHCDPSFICKILLNILILDYFLFHFMSINNKIHENNINNKKRKLLFI